MRSPYARPKTARLIDDKAPMHSPARLPGPERATALASRCACSPKWLIERRRFLPSESGGRAPLASMDGWRGLQSARGLRQHGPQLGNHILGSEFGGAV